MPSRCIEPALQPVDAELVAPPSKSWTHRALVVAALAEGVSRIEHPLDAADTRRTREGLSALGVPIEDTERSWIVHGQAGTIVGGASVACGESGTTARFLTALAALGSRPSVIDGAPRLRERPMDELVAALRSLAAPIGPEQGRLPLTVGGPGIRGGAVSIAGGRSSQFASALLLIAPALPGGLALEVAPPRASFSYALLTAQVLGRFGVDVERPGEGSFRIVPQRVAPASLRSEGDHSSASYLFLAAAVTGGRVRVTGLDPESLQPDARFARDLATIGCTVTTGESQTTVEGARRLEPFDWDLEGAPDLAPSASVLALFARGASRLRGLANLRVKESDRLAALERNLARFGADVRAAGGELLVRPGPDPSGGALVDVVGDHRIAMAFAVAGLRVPGITLSDASVVEKSYPGFWRDFERLRGA
jgi:3-phosphoshikimate 1-carboxyvinyltransferase